MNEIKQVRKPAVFVGLPCHIEGLRLFQQFHKEFIELIPYCISTFCGGYKSYHWIDKLLSLLGIDPSKVISLKFRTLGWPGELEIKDIEGKVVRYPYPAYGSLTDDVEPRRCALCIDALGELADISIGDAWLPHYLEKRKSGGWSIAIARSNKGKELLEEIKKYDLAFIKPISISEVVKAQYQNIEFKKIRQNTRRWVFKILGGRLPTYDGGYLQHFGNPFVEMRTILRIIVNEWEWEKISWKRIIAKSFKRALKFKKKVKKYASKTGHTRY